MPGIFFSYRRALTGGYAGHLRTSLGEIYRADHIALDIEIEPGEDFERWIKQRIASCHILLVILGPGWAQLADASGRRRLEDPHDYARIEIEEGLSRGVPIIPILVGEAKMPTALELPTSIAQLSRLHAIEISDERWEYDVQRLLRTIERVTREAIPKIAPVPDRGDTGRFEPLPPVEQSGPIVFETGDFDIELGSSSRRTVIDVDPTDTEFESIGTTPHSFQESQYANISQPAPAETSHRDRTRGLVTWGWILATIGAALFPLPIVAIVLGALVITRSEGRRTRTGMAIIIVSLVVSALRLSLYYGSGV